MIDQTNALFKLAHAYGIETAFTNDSGKKVEATPDALMALLRQLDCPIQEIAQSEDFYHLKRIAVTSQPLAKANVIWLDQDDGYGEVPLFLPDKELGLGRAKLVLENGVVVEWDVEWKNLRMTGESHEATVSFQTRMLEIPEKIPIGYHRLTVEGIKGKPCLESLILGAPQKAFGANNSALEKTWGVFLPLYAVRSDRNLGVGDITDLQELFEWTARHGGKVVGTLPLLAAFLDEPCEISPYSPASKLFWNEIYIDLEKIPEVEYSSEAKALLNDSSFLAEASRLRDLPLVDYPAVMRLKRRVLEELARTFFQFAPGERRSAFDAFLNARPDTADYALFRAGVERFKSSWHSWPDPLRLGQLQIQDVDPAKVDYHRLVQFWMAEQVEKLSQRAKECGARGLYLDLPLGVNSDSYDVYRHRELFALGASGGAPPDGFFTLGQDWGFPPLRPDRILNDQMGYYRSCLAHHMKSAAMLRVDHVMGLHRLYWVPRGLGAKNGAYIRYPVEPLYAAFNIESIRHQAAIVGEDLGTVPPEVRPAMEAHGWHRLFVGQFEINPGTPTGINSPPEGAIAAMNTHDMPPFASLWEGKDILDRVEMGLISKENGAKEKESRVNTWLALIKKLVNMGVLERNVLLKPLDSLHSLVYKKIMHLITQSNAGLVLMNAEDIWSEVLPQNVPGTWKEKPNWQRKARYPLNKWDDLEGVHELLKSFQQAFSLEKPS